MFLFKLVYFIVYKYLDTEFLGTFLSSIIAGSVLIIFKYFTLGVESWISPLYCDEDSDNNGESSSSRENKDKKEASTVGTSPIKDLERKLKEFAEEQHKPRQRAYDCMLRIKEKDPHYFLDKSNFDSLNYIKILYLVEESKGSPLTPTDMHIAQSMLFGMVVTKEEYEQVGKPIIPNLNIIFPLEIEEVEKICYRKE